MTYVHTLLRHILRHMHTLDPICCSVNNKKVHRLKQLMDCDACDVLKVSLCFGNRCIIWTSRPNLHG